MVFYFTSTGNCLYVAKSLDENCVSIPHVKAGAVYEDDVIGVVAPIYGHDISTNVREFFEQTTLKAKYFYVILTYGFCQGGATTRLAELLASLGKPADYIQVLKMVDNALPAFDIEHELAIDAEKDVDGHLAQIKEDIAARRHFIAQPSQWDIDYHEQFLKAPFKLDPETDFRAKGREMYTISDDCVGCGICSRVCPKGCITIENGKAHQKMDKCIACLGCIHACPHKAIHFTFPEKNPNARYRNPHVKLSEIIESNWQKR